MASTTSADNETTDAVAQPTVTAEQTVQPIKGTEKPAPVPTPTPPAPKPPVNDKAQVSQKVDDDIVNGNLMPFDANTNRFLITALETLRNKNPQRPEAVAAAQITFYNAIIRGLVNSTLDDSKVFIKNLLAYMFYYRETACSPKMLFRQFNKLNLSENDSVEFKNMLFIFSDTCDPATRAKNINEMNWQNFGRWFLSKNGAVALERIKAFYAV